MPFSEKATARATTSGGRSSLGWCYLDSCSAISLLPRPGGRIAWMRASRPPPRAAIQAARDRLEDRA